MKTIKGDWVTVRIAADLLAISRRQVHRLLRRKKLAFTQLGPRGIRVERASIERLIEEGKG